jgi:hypothetical protein
MSQDQEWRMGEKGGFISIFRVVRADQWVGRLSLAMAAGTGIVTEPGPLGKFCRRDRQVHVSLGLNSRFYINNHVK